MNCIFCQIVSGQIPSFEIYQDNDFLAFLDINPLSPGHSLLIPKKHYRWVYDVPNFDQYWQTARKIALASLKAINADFISFLTLGQEVEHAHIHIIPRFKNDDHTHGIDTHNTTTIPDQKMTQISQQINNLINHG